MFTTIHRGIMSTGLLHRSLVAAAVVVSLCAGLATPVFAQRYKSIPPKLAIRQAKALGIAVVNTERNASAFQDGGKEKIDQYFKTFYFPMMTQHKPTDLERLGKLREDLFKRHLRATTVPAAQEHLTNLTLNIMRVISRDNYHPAVRYNATLILGMLDNQYPRGGANPQEPIVLAAGTNELLELLEQDKFKEVKVHPSVKMGALEGLERHLRFSMEQQYAERVTKAAMAVLQQEASKLEVDEDVNNWMKCQAAKVLTRQFQAGPTAEVHAAMTKLIADEEMSLDDRCCIVGLLKKMNYAAGGDVDVAATVLPLGTLTQAVVAEGAEKAQEFEDIILGKKRVKRKIINVGGRNGPQGPQLERRHLLSCLTQITAGAESLSAALPDADKEKITGLVELLEPVKTVSADKKSLDLDVAGEVIKLESSLETMIASWQPAAAAAEDADAAFSE